MSSAGRAIVDVVPGRALVRRPRLFAALEAAYAVTFRARRLPGERVADGTLAIVGEGRTAMAVPEAAPARPVLVVDGGAPRTGPREDVTLARHPGLDRRLHGVQLQDQPVAPPATNVALAHDRGGRPVWTLGPGPVHRVGTQLLELAPGLGLWSLLSRQPLACLALVQFIRSLCEPFDWRPPPLRAAFTFDDPNLRCVRYGFIDYATLLAAAEQGGWHAAIATVPLDGPHVNRRAAQMFARHRDRLSLLVHGNDHVREELRALREPAAALAAAAQARRRADRLAQRAGVTVDRVMTPPHGLCSEAMARAIAAVGFDALCAEHPLPWTERLPDDSLLAGWRPAEFVGGCAVIPRIPLGSSRASIALRAFLDHPLVIYGHHDDVAGGLDRLGEVAAFVGELGDARWCPVGEIATGNFALRVQGDRAELRALSRRVRVQLPTPVRELTVARPPDLRERDALAGWSLDGGEIRPFGEPATVTAAGPAAIALHGRDDVDPAGVPAPRWRAGPRLRRAATEARDRAMPLTQRVRYGASGTPGRTTPRRASR